MLLLSIFVFGMAPVYNRAVTHSEEDHCILDYDDEGHYCVDNETQDEESGSEQDSTFFQVHSPAYK